MIMKQEEKIIYLISYCVLLTVSRKYFLGYVVLLKSTWILRCFITDIMVILELHGY